jgi:hypothetical protein
MDPITLTLAAVGIGGQLLGGVLGAQRERAQAEIVANQAKERVKFIDAIYNREIIKTRGVDVAKTGASGISMAGSSVLAAAEESYELSLKKHLARVFELQRATSALAAGEMGAQAEMGKAVGRSISTGADFYNTASAEKKTKDLEKEREGN